MKSVKMSAKMFLAIAAVAGLSLTSCEKEDFNVTAPQIDVNFPNHEGTTYVMLTATDTDGKPLNDVEFLNGTEVVENGMIAVKTENKEPKTESFTIKASKDGYLSHEKTFQVTALPNQVINQPVSFILTKVEGEDVPVVEGTETPNAEAVEDIVKLPNIDGDYQPNKEYSITIPVPTADPYITEEQKAALYSAIDALTGPTSTRANDADLETAKEMLRAKVSGYPVKARTEMKDFVMTVPKIAENVEIILTSSTANTNITISAIVNGATYSVQGSYTTVTNTVVTGKADGVVFGHGHGHGHGDGDGAGGSITTPKA